MFDEVSFPEGWNIQYARSKVLTWRSTQCHCLQSTAPFHFFLLRQRILGISVCCLGFSTLDDGVGGASVLGSGFHFVVSDGVRCGYLWRRLIWASAGIGLFCCRCRFVFVL
ncbi:hypothetical protein Rs2_15760 [Raphanus sativus]|nr:hypothetical protein Rs2_15760 [Raphanus sativus]